MVVAKVDSQLEGRSLDFIAFGVFSCHFVRLLFLSTFWFCGWTFPTPSSSHRYAFYLAFFQRLMTHTARSSSSTLSVGLLQGRIPTPNMAAALKWVCCFVCTLTCLQEIFCISSKTSLPIYNVNLAREDKSIYKMFKCKAKKRKNVLFFPYIFSHINIVYLFYFHILQRKSCGMKAVAQKPAFCL